jgi:hypothetical protein
LAFLAARPGGEATTSELIKHLEDTIEPEGEDGKILEGRADTKFSQIVRNLVSHRGTDKNPIKRGLIHYEAGKHILRITDLGRDALSKARAP